MSGASVRSGEVGGRSGVLRRVLSEVDNGGNLGRRNLDDRVTSGAMKLSAVVVGLLDLRIQVILMNLLSLLVLDGLLVRCRLLNRLCLVVLVLLRILMRSVLGLETLLEEGVADLRKSPHGVRIADKRHREIVAVEGDRVLVSGTLLSSRVALSDIRGRVLAVANGHGVVLMVTIARDQLLGGKAWLTLRRRSLLGLQGAAGGGRGGIEVVLSGRRRIHSVDIGWLLSIERSLTLDAVVGPLAVEAKLAVSTVVRVHDASD